MFQTFKMFTKDQLPVERRSDRTSSEFNHLKGMSTTQDSGSTPYPTSMKPISKYNILHSYFECNFNADSSKSIAQEFKRQMKSSIKDPSHLEELRNKIIYLHNYNIKVAEISVTYPFSIDLSELLLQYVLMEYRVLYRRHYYTGRNEIKAQDRILRLLLAIYNAYFESKLVPAKKTFEKSAKAIINIFIEIRRDYGLNNALLENMTKILLKKMGHLEKIEALIGKSLPCPLDTYLKNDPVFEIYKNTVTSDYGTDDGSSNGFQMDDEPDDIQIVCETTESNKETDGANEEPPHSTDEISQTLSRPILTICLDYCGPGSDEEIACLAEEVKPTAEQEKKALERTRRLLAIQEENQKIARRRLYRIQEEFQERNHKPMMVVKGEDEKFDQFENGENYPKPLCSLDESVVMSKGLPSKANPSEAIPTIEISDEDECTESSSVHTDKTNDYSKCSSSNSIKIQSNKQENVLCITATGEGDVETQNTLVIVEESEEEIYDTFTKKLAGELACQRNSLRECNSETGILTESEIICDDNKNLPTISKPNDQAESSVIEIIDETVSDLETDEEDNIMILLDSSDEDNKENSTVVDVLGESKTGTLAETKKLKSESEEEVFPKNKSPESLLQEHIILNDCNIDLDNAKDSKHGSSSEILQDIEHTHIKNNNTLQLTSTHEKASQDQFGVRLGIEATSVLKIGEKIEGNNEESPEVNDSVKKTTLLVDKVSDDTAQYSTDRVQESSIVSLYQVETLSDNDLLDKSDNIITTKDPSQLSTDKTYESICAEAAAAVVQNQVEAFDETHDIGNKHKMKKIEVELSVVQKENFNATSDISSQLLTVEFERTSTEEALPAILQDQEKSILSIDKLENISETDKTQFSIVAESFSVIDEISDNSTEEMEEVNEYTEESHKTAICAETISTDETIVELPNIPEGDNITPDRLMTNDESAIFSTLEDEVSNASDETSSNTPQNQVAASLEIKRISAGEIGETNREDDYDMPVISEKYNKIEASTLLVVKLEKVDLTNYLSSKSSMEKSGESVTYADLTSIHQGQFKVGSQIRENMTESIQIAMEKNNVEPDSDNLPEKFVLPKDQTNDDTNQLSTVESGEITTCEETISTVPIGQVETFSEIVVIINDRETQAIPDHSDNVQISISCEEECSTISPEQVDILSENILATGEKPESQKIPESSITFSNQQTHLNTTELEYAITDSESETGIEISIETTSEGQVIEELTQEIHTEDSFTTNQETLTSQSNTESYENYTDQLSDNPSILEDPIEEVSISDNPIEEFKEGKPQTSDSETEGKLEEKQTHLVSTELEPKCAINDSLSDTRIDQSIETLSEEQVILEVTQEIHTEDSFPTNQKTRRSESKTKSSKITTDPFSEDRSISRDLIEDVSKSEHPSEECKEGKPQSDSETESKPEEKHTLSKPSEFELNCAINDSQSDTGIDHSIERISEEQVIVELTQEIHTEYSFTTNQETPTCESDTKSFEIINDPLPEDRSVLKYPIEDVSISENPSKEFKEGKSQTSDSETEGNLEEQHTLSKSTEIELNCAINDSQSDTGIDQSIERISEEQVIVELTQEIHTEYSFTTNQETPTCESDTKSFEIINDPLPEDRSVFKYPIEHVSISDNPSKEFKEGKPQTSDSETEGNLEEQHTLSKSTEFELNCAINDSQSDTGIDHSIERISEEQVIVELTQEIHTEDSFTTNQETPTCQSDTKSSEIITDPLPEDRSVLRYSIEKDSISENPSEEFKEGKPQTSDSETEGDLEEQHTLSKSTEFELNCAINDSQSDTGIDYSIERISEEQVIVELTQEIHTDDSFTTNQETSTCQSDTKSSEIITDPLPEDGSVLRYPIEDVSISENPSKEFKEGKPQTSDSETEGDLEEQHTLSKSTEFELNCAINDSQSDTGIDQSIERISEEQVIVELTQEIHTEYSFTTNQETPTCESDTKSFEIINDPLPEDRSVLKYPIEDVSISENPSKEFKEGKPQTSDSETEGNLEEQHTLSKSTEFELNFAINDSQSDTGIDHSIEGISEEQVIVELTQEIHTEDSFTTNQETPTCQSDTKSSEIITDPLPEDRSVLRYSIEKDSISENPSEEFKEGKPQTSDSETEGDLEEQHTLSKSTEFELNCAINDSQSDTGIDHSIERISEEQVIVELTQEIHTEDSFTTNQETPTCQSDTKSSEIITDPLPEDRSVLRYSIEKDSISENPSEEFKEGKPQTSDSETEGDLEEQHTLSKSTEFELNCAINDSQSDTGIDHSIERISEEQVIVELTQEIHTDDSFTTNQETSTCQSDTKSSEIITDPLPEDGSVLRYSIEKDSISENPSEEFKEGKPQTSDSETEGDLEEQNTLSKSTEFELNCAINDSQSDTGIDQSIERISEEQVIVELTQEIHTEDSFTTNQETPTCESDTKSFEIINDPLPEDRSVLKYPIEDVSISENPSEEFKEGKPQTSDSVSEGELVDDNSIPASHVEIEHFSETISQFSIQVDVGVSENDVENQQTRPLHITGGEIYLEEHAKNESKIHLDTSKDSTEGFTFEDTLINEIEIVSSSEIVHEGCTISQFEDEFKQGAHSKNKEIEDNSTKVESTEIVNELEEIAKIDNVPQKRENLMEIGVTDNDISRKDMKSTVRFFDSPEIDRIIEKYSNMNVVSPMSEPLDLSISQSIIQKHYESFPTIGILASEDKKIVDNPNFHNQEIIAATSRSREDFSNPAAANMLLLAEVIEEHEKMSPRSGTKNYRKRTVQRKNQSPKKLDRSEGINKRVTRSQTTEPMCQFSCTPTDVLAIKSDSPTSKKIYAHNISDLSFTSEESNDSESNKLMIDKDVCSKSMEKNQGKANTTVETVEDNLHFLESKIAVPATTLEDDDKPYQVSVAGQNLHSYNEFNSSRFKTPGQRKLYDTGPYVNIQTEDKQAIEVDEIPLAERIRRNANDKHPRKCIRGFETSSFQVEEQCNKPRNENKQNKSAKRNYHLSQKLGDKRNTQRQKSSSASENDDIKKMIWKSKKNTVSPTAEKLRKKLYYNLESPLPVDTGVKNISEPPDEISDRTKTEKRNEGVKVFIVDKTSENESQTGSPEVTGSLEVSSSISKLEKNEIELEFDNFQTTEKNISSTVSTERFAFSKDESQNIEKKGQVSKDPIITPRRRKGGRRRIISANSEQKNCDSPITKENTKSNEISIGNCSENPEPGILFSGPATRIADNKTKKNDLDNNEKSIVKCRIDLMALDEFGVTKDEADTYIKNRPKIEELKKTLKIKSRIRAKSNVDENEDNNQTTTVDKIRSKFFTSERKKIKLHSSKDTDEEKVGEVSSTSESMSKSRENRDPEETELFKTEENKRGHKSEENKRSAITKHVRRKSRIKLKNSAATIHDGKSDTGIDRFISKGNKDTFSNHQLLKKIDSKNINEEIFEKTVETKKVKSRRSSRAEYRISPESSLNDNEKKIETRIDKKNRSDSSEEVKSNVMSSGTNKVKPYSCILSKSVESISGDQKFDKHATGNTKCKLKDEEMEKARDKSKNASYGSNSNERYEVLSEVDGKSDRFEEVGDGELEEIEKKAYTERSRKKRKSSCLPSRSIDSEKVVEDRRENKRRMSISDSESTPQGDKVVGIDEKINKTVELSDSHRMTSQSKSTIVENLTNDKKIEDVEYITMKGDKRYEEKRRKSGSHSEAIFNDQGRSSKTKSSKPVPRTSNSESKTSHQENKESRKAKVEHKPQKPVKVDKNSDKVQEQTNSEPHFLKLVALNPLNPNMDAFSLNNSEKMVKLEDQVPICQPAEKVLSVKLTQSAFDISGLNKKGTSTQCISNSRSRSQSRTKNKEKRKSIRERNSSTVSQGLNICQLSMADEANIANTSRSKNQALKVVHYDIHLISQSVSSSDENRERKIEKNENGHKISENNVCNHSDEINISSYLDSSENKAQFLSSEKIPVQRKYKLSEDEHNKSLQISSSLTSSTTIDKPSGNNNQDIAIGKLPENEIKDVGKTPAENKYGNIVFSTSHSTSKNVKEKTEMDKNFSDSLLKHREEFFGLSDENIENPDDPTIIDRTLVNVIANIERDTLHLQAGKVEKGECDESNFPSKACTNSGVEKKIGEKIHQESYSKDSNIGNDLQKENYGEREQCDDLKISSEPRSSICEDSLAVGKELQTSLQSRKSDECTDDNRKTKFAFEIKEEVIGNCNVTLQCSIPHSKNKMERADNEEKHDDFISTISPSSTIEKKDEISSRMPEENISECLIVHNEESRPISSSKIGSRTSSIDETLAKEEKYKESNIISRISEPTTTDNNVNENSISSDTQDVKSLSISKISVEEMENPHSNSQCENDKKSIPIPAILHSRADKNAKRKTNKERSSSKVPKENTGSEPLVVQEIKVDSGEVIERTKGSDIISMNDPLSQWTTKKGTKNKKRKSCTNVDEENFNRSSLVGEQELGSELQNVRILGRTIRSDDSTEVSHTNHENSNNESNKKLKISSKVFEDSISSMVENEDITDKTDKSLNSKKDQSFNSEEHSAVSNENKQTNYEQYGESLDTTLKESFDTIHQESHGVALEVKQKEISDNLASQSAISVCIQREIIDEIKIGGSISKIENTFEPESVRMEAEATTNTQDDSTILISSIVDQNKVAINQEECDNLDSKTIISESTAKQIDCRTPEYSINSDNVNASCQIPEEFYAINFVENHINVVPDQSQELHETVKTTVSDIAAVDEEISIIKSQSNAEVIINKLESNDRTRIAEDSDRDFKTKEYVVDTYETIGGHTSQMTECQLNTSADFFKGRSSEISDDIAENPVVETNRNEIPIIMQVNPTESFKCSTLPISFEKRDIGSIASLLNRSKVEENIDNETSVEPESTVDFSELKDKNFFATISSINPQSTEGFLPFVRPDRQLEDTNAVTLDAVTTHEKLQMEIGHSTSSCQLELKEEITKIDIPEIDSEVVISSEESSRLQSKTNLLPYVYPSSSEYLSDCYNILPSSIVDSSVSEESGSQDNKEVAPYISEGFHRLTGIEVGNDEDHTYSYDNTADPVFGGSIGSEDNYFTRNLTKTTPDDNSLPFEFKDLSTDYKLDEFNESTIKNLYNLASSFFPIPNNDASDSAVINHPTEESNNQGALSADPWQQIIANDHCQKKVVVVPNDQCLPPFFPMPEESDELDCTSENCLQKVLGVPNDRCSTPIFDISNEDFFISSTATGYCSPDRKSKTEESNNETSSLSKEYSTSISHSDSKSSNADTKEPDNSSKDNSKKSNEPKRTQKREKCKQPSKDFIPTRQNSRTRPAKWIRNSNSVSNTNTQSQIKKDVISESISTDNLLKLPLSKKDSSKVVKILDSSSLPKSSPLISDASHPCPSSPRKTNPSLFKDKYPQTPSLGEINNKKERTSLILNKMSSPIERSEETGRESIPKISDCVKKQAKEATKLSSKAEDLLNPPLTRALKDEQIVPKLHTTPTASSKKYHPKVASTLDPSYSPKTLPLISDTSHPISPFPGKVIPSLRKNQDLYPPEKDNQKGRKSPILLNDTLCSLTSSRDVRKVLASRPKCPNPQEENPEKTKRNPPKKKKTEEMPEPASKTNIDIAEAVKFRKRKTTTFYSPCPDVKTPGTANNKRKKTSPSSSSRKSISPCQPTVKTYQSRDGPVTVTTESENPLRMRLKVANKSAKTSPQPAAKRQSDYSIDRILDTQDKIGTKRPSSGNDEKQGKMRKLESLSTSSANDLFDKLKDEGNVNVLFSNKTSDRFYDRTPKSASGTKVVSSPSIRTEPSDIPKYASRTRPVSKGPCRDSSYYRVDGDLQKGNFKYRGSVSHREYNHPGHTNESYYRYDSGRIGGMSQPTRHYYHGQNPSHPVDARRGQSQQPPLRPESFRSYPREAPPAPGPAPPPPKGPSAGRGSKLPEKKVADLLDDLKTTVQNHLRFFNTGEQQPDWIEEINKKVDSSALDPTVGQRYAHRRDFGKQK